MNNFGVLSEVPKSKFHDYIPENKAVKAIKMLKKGIWLYFLLLIFEGALRKWVLPNLASPLLIIRDPIALWLLFYSVQKGVYKPNLYVILAWIITMISLYATLLFGHGNVFVALYGFRIFALHFPLIFIIGKVFDKSDALQIGKVLLWLHIGMTILVALQFFSPQSAWVNRGIGGDMDGSGFFGTGEFYRVPGTFSFTNGLSFFYGFVISYIFYFYTNDSKLVSKWLLIVATIAYLIAIPLSVSRTVFFQTIVSLLFTIVILGRNSRSIAAMGGAVVFLVMFLGVLSSLEFFRVAVDVFMNRFENANTSEGGVEGLIFERFLGGMLGSLNDDSNTEILGKGLGMGTNVGAAIMTGERRFLISEGEWGRLIGEMGMVLGFLAIVIRVFLVFYMLRKSFFSIQKMNYLPWMLLSFASILVLQGQWAQPTALGFSVFSGGLLLASLNNHKIDMD